MDSDNEHRRRSCYEKKRYWSLTHARGVAATRERNGAPPLRAYHCDLCLGFHLTKMKEPVHE